MSILVEQQDETIEAIQTAAMSVEKDTEVGYVQAFSSRFMCLISAIKIAIHRQSRCFGSSCTQEAVDLLRHHSHHPCNYRNCGWCGSRTALAFQKQ